MKFLSSFAEHRSLFRQDDGEILSSVSNQCSFDFIRRFINFGIYVAR